MKKGTHGANEETFKELSYAGQAKTLNSQILNIERGLNAHISQAKKESKNIDELKEKYRLQLERLIKGLS